MSLPTASEEKEAELVLRRTLEQVVMTAVHPRLGIQVIIQVVSSDGSVEACAAGPSIMPLV